MYAPAEARRRQMEAAERLVAQIDPGQIYPQEFVIFRITGYRPDRAEAPVALVGEALVGDLVTLIQRLSHGLRIASDEAGRTAVPLEDLTRRLKVSAKTLQRYRRRGLVCHYVVFPDGVKRLACFEDAVDRFVSRNRERIDRAATFSRTDDAVQQTMISEARQQRRETGLSLNAAARRLARKYGRAHETVRSILRRHDRIAGEPIFAERGPLRDRDVRLIHRAARMGVSPAVLARRFGKAPATIHRAINRRRGELLRELDLRFVSLPAMDEDGAESAILGDPSASSDLLPRLPDRDALALIDAVHGAGEAAQAGERVLAVGYNLLKRRARRAIETLPTHPGSHQLDRAETDLRWAAMLKRRLVEIGLPGAVGAIERSLGRDVSLQPSEEIVALLQLSIEVVAETVETLDPRRQRLARAAGPAMSRALEARRHHPPPGRAATRHQPGSVVMAGPFGSLCPWQPWLALRPDLAALVDRLDPSQGRLVGLRYGLSGQKPLTLRELADQTGGNPSTVARLIAAAEGQLRRARREQPEV
jgi:RNA polymerase primary sigma factor